MIVTRKPVVYLLLVIAFGGISFFLNIGGWDLWNPDEPRYAQVAKEMLQGKGWIIPHRYGEVYYDKPPLFFWLITVSAKLLGKMDERAVRFPSAVFGLATLVTVFLFGMRLFNEDAGLFSALILATNAEYFWLARRGGLDVTLTFFTTLAIYLFFAGFQEGKWRSIYYLFAYFAIGLGFMTKLQPAAIVPFFAMGGYFVIKKRFDFFWDKAHLPGIGCLLLLIGGWLYAAYLKEGVNYLWGLLFQTSSLTFFKALGHAKPFYWYFGAFPADFLPWSVLLPSAIIYGFKRKAMREQAVLPFIWFSSIFLFFSLAEAKRELYLLPVYPAVSLMTGYLWADVTHGAPEPRFFRGSLFFLLAISILGGASLPFLVTRFGLRYLLRPLEIGCVLGSVLVAGSILAFFSYRSGRKTLTFLFLISTIFALCVYSVVRVFPEINRYKSVRPLAEVVSREMKPGDRLGVYRLEGAGFSYYTDIDPIERIKEKRALNDFLRSGNRVFCIMRERDYERLLQNRDARLFLVAKPREEHRPLVIISNREVRK